MTRIRGETTPSNLHHSPLECIGAINNLVQKADAIIELYQQTEV